MRQAALLFSVALIFGSVPLSAQSPGPSQAPLEPMKPLQVGLLAALDVAKATPETKVFAKVLIDWNDPDCHLHAGAVISGHVTRVERQTKEKKGSNITLTFDHADCEGRSSSDVQLIVIGAIAVPWVDSTRALFDTLNANPNLVHVDPGSSGATTGMGFASDGSISYGFGGGSGGGSIGHPTFDPSNEKAKIPSVMKPGEVYGMKQVSVGVGKGLDGASVFQAAKGNLRFEESSQIFLMPKEAFSPDQESIAAAAARQHSTGASGGAGSELAAATAALPSPLVPEVDETSICTAPCSLVNDQDALRPAKASLTLPISTLGYKPHEQKNNRLNFEAALSYVGPDNLLFTYDPHDLRHRYPSGFSTESIRTVRAVLLDRNNLSVKRMVDWQIQGEGQYLWHTGTDGLLIHLGHTLRLLGPDLNAIREISIPGRLVFVSTSPSGSHIVVGTIHELHTKAMHDELVEALHGEPEESVAVQVYDQNLAPLFSTHQSSALPAPILSDAGEIRVSYAGKSHWSIRELRWDNTEHIVANLISQCTPNITLPRSDSIFLVGCTKSAFDNWYRILRLDGHLLLSGHGSGLQTEQCFSSQNGDLAVRMIVPKPGMARGELFSKKDLVEQRISVYRSKDGKRLFSTGTPGVSLVQQAFAISPTGDQLAALTDTNIAVYAVAKPTP